MNSQEYFSIFDDYLRSMARIKESMMRMKESMDGRSIWDLGPARLDSHDVPTFWEAVLPPCDYELRRAIAGLNQAIGPVAEVARSAGVHLLNDDNPDAEPLKPIQNPYSTGPLVSSRETCMREAQPCSTKQAGPTEGPNVGELNDAPAGGSAPRGMRGRPRGKEFWEAHTAFSEAVLQLRISGMEFSDIMESMMPYLEQVILEHPRDKEPRWPRSIRTTGRGWLYELSQEEKVNTRELASKAIEFLILRLEKGFRVSDTPDDMILRHLMPFMCLGQPSPSAKLIELWRDLAKRQACGRPGLLSQ